MSLLTADRDDEGLNCLPVGVPMIDFLPSPFKLIQTPRVLVMLAEAHTAFRQIFTDGRKHPNDPQPSWLGYSTGRWDGDTLVVETLGFNDRSHLDAYGHSHTSALRVTERFRRRDVGHLDMQITIDDTGILTRPVTFDVPARLLPDGDLIEYVCSENEKDLKHVSLR
jgi:hypothetical protein